jgi:hypothetical protein
MHSGYLLPVLKSRVHQLQIINLCEVEDQLIRCFLSRLKTQHTEKP